ncbi:hypothetical protein [Alcaligenes endophyticus]|uniref:Mercuric transport protein MerT n=1 Tax=Alcaligenes endophyticus TaxID=1929088 RepID=A0ABT8EHH2_9BURK|nr:hypothetical protein [Alcaligenes endophyticus]MCX5589689.1 hypothetical protein [Alcaligenes endophyticus]MDN4120647.1 hypothetical protein [Alcaligenes endophyticus]
MSTGQKSKAKLSGNGIGWSLGGAMLAALGAGLCCLAPLLYLLFGVSAAALSSLSRLSWLQIPMSLLAFCFLGIGYYRLYLSKRPVCTRIGSLNGQRFLYWAVLGMVVLLLSYPFTLPLLLEQL